MTPIAVTVSGGRCSGAAAAAACAPSPAGKPIASSASSEISEPNPDAASLANAQPATCSPSCRAPNRFSRSSAASAIIEAKAITAVA